MRAVSSSSGAFPTEQVLELWRTSDAVAFDVDSTVCIDEGIDELGVYVGTGERWQESRRKRWKEGFRSVRLCSED